MPFTEKITVAVEKLVHDQWGVTGRTQEYGVFAAKVLGADADNSQTMVLSADLSAYAIAIAPLGVSNPAMLIVLSTDLPVDLRTNAATDATFLSSVRFWAMAGYVSNLFVTTGSAVTTMWLKVAGGSNASLDASFPLP